MLKRTLMSALCALLLSNVSFAENQTNFSDMPSSNWAYQYVTEMANKKIVTGYSNGTFMPDKNVTKAELAKILALAANLSPSNTTQSSFSDVKPSDWFCGYAEITKNDLKGTLIEGQLYFRPKFFATREQVAAAIISLKKYTLTNDIMPKFRTTIKDADQVSPDFQLAVARAMDLGIISGYPDGNFAPKDPVTRAQLCKIIYQAFFKPDKYSLSIPTDIAYSSSKDLYSGQHMGIAITAITRDTTSGSRTIKIWENDKVYSLNISPQNINTDDFLKPYDLIKFNYDSSSGTITQLNMLLRKSNLLDSTSIDKSQISSISGDFIVFQTISIAYSGYVSPQTRSEKKKIIRMLPYAKYFDISGTWPKVISLSDIKKGDFAQELEADSSTGAYGFLVKYKQEQM
jgi:hypothetical protein